MKLIDKLLYWFTGRLPCRIISDDGKPYLERYHLGTLLGVRFYIHRFVGSDPARGLHDHPWLWAGSLVLSGWYWEERRGTEQHAITRVLAALCGTTGIVRRKVRWFNWLTGDSFHRVVLPKNEQRLIATVTASGVSFEEEDKPCWTLFFHRASYTKPWGFLRTVSDDPQLIWVPHNYPKDGTGTPGAWWNEKPTGNFEPRRQPLRGPQKFTPAQHIKP